MTLLQRYLTYLSEICEGSRQAPAGITLTKQGDMERAIELQQQISSIGIPEFVRLCALQDGETIAQEELDSFDPAQLLQALGAMEQSEDAAPPQEPEAPAESDTPTEPVKSEIRDIYEVFLDSVCLEDDLFAYLIDILKRGDKEAFQTLSHAAARTLLDMDEFLLWLGSKELLGDADEQACAAIMDACLERLMQEGQRELAAALLSGDETTFKLFRTQAPELVHLPDATYEWFSKNYLDRYYPVRFILRNNGVQIPSYKDQEHQ